MAAELDQSTIKTGAQKPRRARPYNAPAGGWGSVRSLARALTRERVVASAPPALLRQNKPDGFACVSCAWAKPADPHVFEFCENGAKATTWEITSRRVDDAFFASYTLRELEAWADHDLEELGRLTRFRGISGTRMVVLMHRNDIDRLELREGEQVRLVTATNDGVDRQLGGLTVIANDIPEGCCAGYYPECNVLVPLWHHAERAKVPAAKSVPVRIVKDGVAFNEPAASSDMTSGHPLSDAGRDVTKLGELALNAAKARPVKTAAMALAAGLVVGLAARGRPTTRR